MANFTIPLNVDTYYDVIYLAEELPAENRIPAISESNDENTMHTNVSEPSTTNVEANNSNTTSSPAASEGQLFVIQSTAGPIPTDNAENGSSGGNGGNGGNNDSNSQVIFQLITDGDDSRGHEDTVTGAITRVEKPLISEDIAYLIGNNLFESLVDAIQGEAGIIDNEFTPYRLRDCTRTWREWSKIEYDTYSAEEDMALEIIRRIEFGFGSNRWVQDKMAEWDSFDQGI